VLDDMLRDCVLAYGKCWEVNLDFAEFSNRYHASLKKAPLEVLYERNCCAPLMWSKVPNFIKVAEEKIAKVRENLRMHNHVKRPAPTRGGGN
jgi:hypothetical protein